MSAQPCGCDQEASWICKAHRDAMEIMKQASEALEVDEQKFDNWRNDRQHIADVLTTFYTAPISMSSLQPLLDLAVELNPSLARGNVAAQGEPSHEDLS